MIRRNDCEPSRRSCAEDQVQLQNDDDRARTAERRAASSRALAAAARRAATSSSVEDMRSVLNDDFDRLVEKAGEEKPCAAARNAVSAKMLVFMVIQCYLSIE